MLLNASDRLLLPFIFIIVFKSHAELWLNFGYSLGWISFLQAAVRVENWFLLIYSPKGNQNKGIQLKKKKINLTELLNRQF